MSEPLKSDVNNNFNTKLKIIDPSFNYKVELKSPKLRFHKFVHINIYSETPDAAPKVQNVGDIIRLRRFRFKYTDKGEVLGNEVNFSNWLIYKALPTKQELSYSYKRFLKNDNRQLNVYEANRISDLRQWTQTFFANNSIMYINWWTGFKENDEAKVKDYKNIDLILKVKGVHSGKNNKLVFVDRDNKQFELSLIDKPTLKEGDIIKLRCVEITVKRDKEVTRSIKVTQHSSCLNILPFSSDAKHFDKAAQEQKRSPAKSTKTVDAFINDYQVEDLGASKSSKSTPKKGPKGGEGKLVSAVRKNFNVKKPSTVEELQAVLKAPGLHHGQRFFFKGYIQDMASTDPKDVIKFMHVDDRKTFALGDRLNHPKKLRPIFNLVLLVQDEAGDSDVALPVYVLTGEYNSHLFSCWKVLPDFEDIAAWQNIKQSKLNEFQKKLETLKGSDNVARLGLELNITKTGTPFLKLVDTVFLA